MDLHYLRSRRRRSYVNSTFSFRSKVVSTRIRSARRVDRVQMQAGRYTYVDNRLQDMWDLFRSYRRPEAGEV